MKTFFSAFLLICCTPLFSQNLHEKIAAEICKEMSSIDLSQTYDQVNTIGIQQIQKTYQKYQAEMNRVVRKMILDNPELDQTSASNSFGKEVTVKLTLNCEIYQRITIFKNKEVPDYKSVTQIAGKAFDQQLRALQDAGKLNEESISSAMFEVMGKYEKEITEAFGGLYSTTFSDEFNRYMLTHSEVYLRSVLLGGG